MSALTPEEEAILFPGDQGDGLTAVGSRLIDVLQAAFTHQRSDGEPLPVEVFPYGSNPLFDPTGQRTALEIGDDAEIKVDSVVLGAPEIQPPTGGADLGGWNPAGENANGTQNRVMFPFKRLVNLLYPVQVLRDNALLANIDMARWLTLWDEYEFLSITGNVVCRTRMDAPLVSAPVAPQFANLILLTGSVEIQRVWIVDPRVVDRTTAVESVTTTLTPLEV